MIAAMFETVGNYYYFYPTYSTAKKAIWEGKTRDGMPFLDFFPKDLIEGKPNDSELKIKFKNGSIFQLIGTDNIDAIMGTSPRGCVFSEFPLQDPKAWQLIRPILAENGGWAIFNGTPRGKNHAWEVMNIGKEEGWFVEILTVDDTNSIPKEVLESERRQMPSALFNQEYYCNFIENAGQFFRRIRENLYEADDVSDETHEYQNGVDLAKYQDYTVITPFDLNTFYVKQQDRFNQVDWNLQKARISASAFKYNNARVKIDRTGVGDPIVEDLIAQGLNISEDDAIVFTEAMRMNLLNNLSMMIEQDKIKIPNEEGLIKELESFQYTLSASGKIKVGAPENMHDDRVMSLALAVHGTTNPLGVSSRTGKVEDDFGMYATHYG